MTGEGFVRLGELRRRQGKLDEAMELFDRCGSHPLASLGRASVMFDRGDFKTGADLAERHLRRLPASNRTERAAALELMVRACLEQGRVDEATQAVTELQRHCDRGRDGAAARAGQLSRPAWCPRARATEGRPRSSSKMPSICFRRADRRSKPAARASSWRGVMQALGRSRRRRRRSPTRDRRSDAARRQPRNCARPRRPRRGCRRPALRRRRRAPTAARALHAARDRDSSAHLDRPEQSGDRRTPVHQRTHRPPARRQHAHQAQRLVAIGRRRAGRTPRSAVDTSAAHGPFGPF